jgi:hypothetical protein
MKVILGRILGNDLPPRHPEGQTRRNLAYILENEPDYGAERVWLLNRIVDSSEREAIIKLLGNERFLEIEINWENYSKLSAVEDKWHYLTNVNRARNTLIEIGFGQGADLVLPLDGSCFFRDDGWTIFFDIAYSHPFDGFFSIPMSRCAKIQDLHESRPKISEFWSFGKKTIFAMTEPQIAFGKDHDAVFSLNAKYSMASKVELLWRLGIRGVWSEFYPEMQRGLTPSRFFGEVRQAGWVYRLPSGNEGADTSNVIRSQDRNFGLRKLVETADAVYQQLHN